MCPRDYVVGGRCYMPHIFKIKRSSEPGAVPTNLQAGELAYNFADHRLYIGGPNGELHEINADAVLAVQPTPVQPEALPPPQTPALPDGFTTTGIRRRLLPFEQ